MNTCKELIQMHATADKKTLKKHSNADKKERKKEKAYNKITLLKLHQFAFSLIFVLVKLCTMTMK